MGVLFLMGAASVGFSPGPSSYPYSPYFLEEEGFSEVQICYVGLAYYYSPGTGMACDPFRC